MRQVSLWMIVIGLLVMVGPVSAAPILAWDAVTTDEAGQPLGAGLGVTTYRVYRCGPSATGPCAAPDRALIGTVLAPATSLDLVGQPMPQAYVVTAVNKAAESVDSVKLKLVPPDAPRNPRLP